MGGGGGQNMLLSYREVDQIFWNANASLKTRFYLGVLMKSLPIFQRWFHAGNPGKSRSNLHVRIVARIKHAP